MQILVRFDQAVSSVLQSIREEQASAGRYDASGVSQTPPGFKVLGAVKAGRPEASADRASSRPISTDLSAHQPCHV
jgi:hypothetical protein